MDLLAQKYSQDFKTQLDILRMLKTFIETQTDTTVLACMDMRVAADTQEGRCVHTGGADTSTHWLLSTPCSSTWKALGPGWYSGRAEGEGCYCCLL